MEKIVYYLEELACPDCAEKIGQILEKQKGIHQAKIIYATGKAKIQYDPQQITEEEIKKVIAMTGYKVESKR